MAPEKGDGFSPAVKAERMWSDLYPSIYIWAYLDSEDANRVILVRRGPADWLSMAKGYGSSGEPVICFGNGSTVLDALASLEGGLASGRWKVDTPFSAK